MHPRRAGGCQLDKELRTPQYRALVQLRLDGRPRYAIAIMIDEPYGPGIGWPEEA